MHLTYTLKLEDMFAFQNYCWKHIPEAKRGRFYLRVAPPLIAIAFVTMMTVNNPPFISMAGVIILIALLYAIFFPILYRYVIGRNFSKQHNGAISERFNFIANETGIAINSSKGKTELFWDAIRNVVATESLILFFYTPLCAIVLPKEAFDSDISCNEFLQYIGQYHTASIISGTK